LPDSRYCAAAGAVAGARWVSVRPSGSVTDMNSPPGEPSHRPRDDAYLVTGLERARFPAGAQQERRLRVAVLALLAFPGYQRVIGR
jgi:hypothetical protein